MNTKKLSSKKKRAQREVKYFKKYSVPSNEQKLQFSGDRKQVFCDGKDVTPLPLNDADYLTYPVGKTVILQKIEVEPLPPATPIEDVDPSVWLNYTPNLEGELKENSTFSLSPPLTISVQGMLRTDAMLEETETIFLLEILSPYLNVIEDTDASGENDKGGEATPITFVGETKKKGKKHVRRKATLDHETQTIPPLLIDAEIETDTPLKRDFSSIATDSMIYDGHVEVSKQDARNSEIEIQHQLKKLSDVLMDPNGVFKHDLSYINFYLKVMAGELKKYTYEEQLKILKNFIKDYEEDADIEELAKELDTDYNGFIKEVKRVRDELYPLEEPEEGVLHIVPGPEIEHIEEKPIPGFEGVIGEDEVQKIRELDDFKYCLPEKNITPEEEFLRVSKSEEFFSALSKIENIFTYQDECEKIQNSTAVECVAEHPDLQSLYSLHLLWEFCDQEAKGKALNCISWCEECSELFAAGYGRRGYENSLACAERGLLLIWSFALPKERPLCKLDVNASIVSICFHPESFHNLALGLSSGDVVLVEINKEVSSISSMVKLQEANSFGQVSALAWFQGEQEDWNEDEPQDIHLVAGGRKGTLFAWKASLGFLTSESVLTIPKICGKVKGIKQNLPIRKVPMSVSLRPEITCIEVHPKCRRFETKDDEIEKDEDSENNEIANILGHDLSHLYLVAAGDGSVHQCYFSKIHYHQDYFRAHNGPIYCLSFNCFIDRVFLTCGGDWAVRIWCLGVGEPLITLDHEMESVESAQWSVHYPTIIASIRGNELCLWDLARRTSSPVSIFVNPKKHKFTSISFSSDGLNILTGDSEGNLCIYHLQDMPFISNFPVQHLVNAIKKALVNKPTILMELIDTGTPFTKE